MFLDIVLSLSFVYFATIVACALAARVRLPLDRTRRPTVSIIIAARNEEQNIGRCLDSMTGLSYPPHLLEIIVVDDRSVDATHSIVARYAREHTQIRLVSAAPESGQLRGKTNAVTQGIEASSGDLLLFTDADCTAPPQWVEETVKYYTDDQVGIVAGYTSLQDTSWFAAMQALDWYALFSVASGAIRFGFPVTAVGNNLSVRRKAYDQVGGYRRIPFSVTEDYALFHAITSGTEYAARFPLDKASAIESTPCQNWRELYNQKKRWFTGGRGMEAKYLLMFGVAYIFHLLLAVGVLFVGGQEVWIALGIKVAADVVLVLPAVSTFRRWHLFRSFVAYELYFLVYVIIYPLIVLTGREIVWKERTF